MSHGQYLNIQCILLFVLVLSSFNFAQSKRQDAIIRSSDTRSIIPVASPFGFASYGVTKLNFKLINPQNISNVNVTQCAKAGFFYTIASPQLSEQLDQYEGRCVFDENINHQVLDTVDKLLQRKNEDELEYQQYLHQVDSAGMQSVMYANCDKVQCNIDFEVVIMESNGNNHLSVGDIPLPILFTVCASIYLVLLIIWCVVIYRRRDQAHKIHYLMGVLLLIIMLDVMCQSGMYFRIQITGDTDGWNIPYYIFTFIRGILFFTVIILVSAGWSYMKPFVGERERKIIMVVIPLQILANVAIVVTDELNISNVSWFSWRNLFLGLDVLCCLAVIFPIIWQIKHLTQATEKDDKLVRCLHKLLLFRRFYVMVVIWVYFTRIVVFLMSYTLPFYVTWVAELASQIAYILFYIISGYIFRPHKENPYFQIQQQDVDDLVLDFEEDEDDNENNVISVKDIESQGLMSKIRLHSDSFKEQNGNGKNGKKKIEMQKVSKD